MLEEQGGVCAICGGDENGRTLAVDHDHQTGQIRGLLCSKCNVAIGYLSDSLEILKNAFAYLEKHKPGG